jgi:hypothetical protein
MQTKRITLYNDFRGDAKENNLLDSFDEKYPGFTDWESINFKDELSTKSTWNRSLKDIIGPTTFDVFIKTFGCDLEWAKKTKYCTTTAKKLDDISCLSIFGTSTGNSKSGCPTYNTKDGEYVFCNNGRGNKIGSRELKYWSCQDGKVIFDGTELSPSETKKATTEKPKPKTVEIPKELDGNSDGKGDSEGVKHFQNWLDTYYAGWAEGYKGGKVGTAKGYGKFGPRTQREWNKHQTEYKDYLRTTEMKPADELEKSTKITRLNRLNNLSLQGTGNANTTATENPIPSNESVLKNTIRKNLMETKETKKSLLVEESIIKNRFGLIIESAKSHNNIEIAFLEVMVEMIKLREMGLSEKALIKEELSFFNLLGGMFGGSGAKQNLMGTLRGTFTEYAAKFLLSKLGISSGSALGRMFITTLGNVESFSDIPKLFSDCRYISELLSKSVVESILGSIGDKYVAGGLLADAVRNSLTDMLYNQTFMKNIQSGISDSVCSIMGDLKVKMSDKAKEMKTKALS